MNKIKENNNNKPFKDTEFISLKITFKIILIILFISLSLILFFTVKSQAIIDDIDYEFEQDIILDTTNLEFDSTFNMRNQTVFTEIYNSSYFLENDTVGNDPHGWTVVEAGSCTGEIVASEGEHSKVLEFDDPDGNGVYAYNYFEETENGTIEFWVKNTDATKIFMIRAWDGGYGGTTAFTIGMRLDEWQDLFGGWNTIAGVEDPRDEVFHHVRIDFECGGGGYLGLGWDEYYATIDGIRCTSAISMQNSAVDLDCIDIYTSNADSGYQVYLDAMGYNWFDNYTIGLNRYPYSYENSTLEVDKWTFFNNEDGSPTINGQGTIPFFTEINSVAYITKNLYQAEDETAVYIPIGGTTHEGIYREMDIAGGTTKEVNIRISMGGNSAQKTLYEYYDIHSYDNTLICRLRIDDVVSSGDLRLSYYDGSSYVEIIDIKNGWWIYNFNITIIENTITLNCTEYDSDTIDYISHEIFMFPAIVNGKNGIDKVNIECYLSDTQVAQTGLFIDSIGVYIDGVSQSNDYATYYKYIGIDFNPRWQHLFTLNATGFFSSFMTSFEMYPQSYLYFAYENSSLHTWINTCNATSILVENSYFAITTNTTFEIYSISIIGIKLTEGLNTYHPITEFHNIDLDDNYFYVIGNTLYYSIDFDSQDNEYMSISFDINNEFTKNSSFGYNSFYEGYVRPYIMIEYVGEGISYYPISITPRASNYLLLQTFIIDKFIFNTTDRDITIENSTYYDNGYTNGYLNSLTLRFIPNIETVLTTMTLIYGFIPLLVMILPTVALHLKFGKKIILPSLILMTLICFVGQLIPLWLFSVLLIIYGYLLLISREVKE